MANETQAPAEGADLPSCVPTLADRREFEVHAAERGFELERYPEGPYVSFHTDKHWQTWRAAQAVPSPAVKAAPVAWKYRNAVWTTLSRAEHERDFDLRCGFKPAEIVPLYPATSQPPGQGTKS